MRFFCPASTLDVPYKSTEQDRGIPESPSLLIEPNNNKIPTERAGEMPISQLFVPQIRQKQGKGIGMGRNGHSHSPLLNE